MAFEGFPAEAFGFYERLEADNSKGFWDAHRGDYARHVREPFLALLGELEAEFGPATLFRPQRDTRFSADKAPYKAYQGAFVERLPGTGFYVQVSADGLTASGGFHSHAADQVDRYRAAVDDAQSGQKLAAIVAELRKAGLSVDGDQLKTRPRGVAADHPRLDLLRYRSLTATRNWPAGPLLENREALALVRQAWQRLIPLCDWACEHVGGPHPVLFNAASIFPMVYHDLARWADEHGFEAHGPGREIWVNEVEDIADVDQQVIEVQLPFTRPETPPA